MSRQFAKQAALHVDRRLTLANPVKQEEGTIRGNTHVGSLALDAGCAAGEEQKQEMHGECGAKKLHHRHIGVVPGIAKRCCTRVGNGEGSEGDLGRQRGADEGLGGVDL
jgi:hypothetical protein